MLLISVLVALWFLPLGWRHLVPSDEGRYAEIAREMLAHGDWVTIRYNDLKYFEKPPFHLWMTAIAYAAFGLGEWQARLWVALSGAAGLLLTMLASRRWFSDRVAMLTGLILLATPTWNLASHFNSLDMGVSAALAGVLAGMLIAQHPDATPGERRAWMWVAWVSMAIGVLTKGLIGIVLPGLVLVAYTLIGRDWRVWRRLHLGTGSLIFLAIVAPWFVLVSRRNPEFLSFFFVHEHFERFTSSVHHRSAPWWYFVPQVIVGFLPWLGLALPMSRVVCEGGSGPGFRPSLFLGLWAVVIFVFFSMSGSKLPGYIVPVFPALAMLGAVALDGVHEDRWRRLIIAAIVIVAAGLLATTLLARLGRSPGLHRSFEEYAGLLAGILALALVGLGWAWKQARTGIDRSIATYAITMFAVASAALLAHETFGRQSSGIELVDAIDKAGLPAMPVYSVRMLDHTLPFYLRHTMIMVEAPDELEFGVRQEPGKWIPSIDEFTSVWTTGPMALALMSPATYELLRARGLSMQYVAADERRVVVTNRRAGRDESVHR